MYVVGSSLLVVVCWCLLLFYGRCLLCVVCVCGACCLLFGVRGPLLVCLLCVVCFGCCRVLFVVCCACVLFGV